MTIYLDFDNTMVESNKRVIEILNKRYGINKSEDDLVDYGYNSIHNISEEEKLSIFRDDDFFRGLEFKPGIIDIITKYYDKFNWAITTKGDAANLAKKFVWLDDNLPFDMEQVGISNDGFSKSCVDMSDGMQIDDLSMALDTNAKAKILYKDFRNYNWQQINPCDDIIVVNTWNEIGDILEFCCQYNIDTLEKKEDV